MLGLVWFGFLDLWLFVASLLTYLLWVGEGGFAVVDDDGGLLLDRWMHAWGFWVMGFLELAAMDILRKRIVGGRGKGGGGGGSTFVCRETIRRSPLAPFFLFSLSPRIYIHPSILPRT